MDEQNYKGIILASKEFVKAPLTLQDMPIAPDATYGYTMSDTVFLMKQWAKEAKGFYFDAIDFLDAVHLNDTKRIEAYKNVLRDKEKIITGELVAGTNDEQTKLSGYWLPLFTDLKEIWKDPSVKERRLVIPLQLRFGELISHASVACFSFKPREDAVDLFLLEQHAQRKGEPDYEPALDYTQGMMLHADALGQVMNQTNNGWLGIKNVRVFVNSGPICRRHNVCGVVASELARGFLLAKDPVEFLTSGLVFSGEDVDRFHERNQKLVKKSRTSLSIIAQKKKGKGKG